jgi:hypothetical protein
MLNEISKLIQFVFNAVKYLLSFLTIIILGIVGAVLHAIPWLLRMGALLLWLSAAYLAITSIQTIYAPFSPSIPVLALQFAVILILVGWVTILLRENTKFFWGGMAAGGLVAGGASFGSNWLLVHWQYADLFFRVLPPTLFSVLLIYETIHLRSLRRNRNAPLDIDVGIVDDTHTVTT